mgnify:FL=1|jgi:uncharacterized protein
MVTIDITDFQSGVHDVELHPDAEDADLDPSTFRDLHVEAELHCRRDRILAHLNVAATATLTCDRTLNPYDESLEGTYSVLFGPASMVGREGDRFDEVRALDPTDREIDVTDIVRDTLLLAVPQRTIAPGAEDEDLTTTFGEPDDAEAGSQDDIDPRWSKLKELKNGSD